MSKVDKIDGVFQNNTPSIEPKRWRDQPKKLYKMSGYVSRVYVDVSRGCYVVFFRYTVVRAFFKGTLILQCRRRDPYRSCVLVAAIVERDLDAAPRRT